MRPLIAIVLAAGLVAGACEAPQLEAPMGPDELAMNASPASVQLPFHSEVDWDFVQVPLPSGRCTGELPEGLSYLWLTELTGTAVSTHLGRGAFEGSLCLYGQLTNPEADPPDNGIPFGWMEGELVLTAANGDRLHVRAWSTGFTAPPGTPGWKFIEEGVFVDGGTGRFQHAEGQFTGYVDSEAQTAVYDGWIRFGKKAP